MITELLYTWVDVQAALEKGVPSWPTSILSARAYWDSVVMEYEAGHGESVDAWLSELFGPRWLGEVGARRIRLESLPDGPDRSLLVSFETAERPATPGIARRTFQRPDTAMRRVPTRPAADHLSPRIFAWHSFKGGVGRTTTALQFAKLLSKRGASVMLVDMDFEAPGITWMTAESRLPTPPIAMSDVLALIHSTPVEQLPEIINLIVARLRDSLVDSFVILPAMRGDRREADIRPEHVEAPGLPPLADVLARIAAALKVTHVIADMRAGRSELAASLLLDQRVARVLVTTAGGQSVKGTEQMLEDLSGAFPGAPGDPPITVLVSRVEGPADFLEVKERLLRSTEELLSKFAEERPFPIRFTAALHNPSLLTLPLDWGDVVQRLDGYSVVDVPGFAVDMTILEWVASEAPSGGVVETAPIASGEPVATAVPPADPVSIRDRRRLLFEFTTKMIVAEGMAAGPLLPAQFLLKLSQAHRSRLPVEVVVGEKGSGKTFTYLQLVKAKAWRTFTGMISHAASIEGLVTPVTWPGALQPEAKAAVDELLGGVNFADRLGAVTMADLRNAMSSDEHFDWRGWWIDRLVARAGLDAPQALSVSLGDVAPLFVVDGIEELFANVHTSPAEQRCLRALLQEVPAWIRGAGSNVGLLVFVRSDYVAAAIPQNTEQFLAQYRPYELWWDHHEARRLVQWASIASGALPGTTSADGSELLHVWGAGTGAGVSPPAPMDAWVMDAMSTREVSASALKARDVMRLLAEASRLSIDRGQSDRLLEWTALLEALNFVGDEKVRELKEQDHVLWDALHRVGELRATKKVPLRYHELTDDADRLALLKLEEARIAWRERGEVWLVPLYRRGLGLALAPRRRERVLR